MVYNKKTFAFVIMILIIQISLVSTKESTSNLREISIRDKIPVVEFNSDSENIHELVEVYGKEITVEGTIDYHFEEDIYGGTEYEKEIYELVDDKGERYTINVREGQDDDIKLGLESFDRVKIEGKAVMINDESDNNILINPAEVNSLESSSGGISASTETLPRTSTVGMKKIAIIMVNSDRDSYGKSESEIRSIFANSDAIIRKNSFGRAGFSQVDVYGPYSMQDSSISSAIEIANPDVYFPDYDFVLVVTDSDRTIGGGGSRTIEDDGIKKIYRFVSIKGYYTFQPDLVAHELLHAFGVKHTSGWIDNSRTSQCVDPPYSCIIGRLGFTLMDDCDGTGVQGSMGIGPADAEYLGWLESEEIKTIGKDDSGSYSLDIYNLPSSKNKVLKIVSNLHHGATVFDQTQNRYVTAPNFTYYLHRRNDCPIGRCNGIVIETNYPQGFLNAKEPNRLVGKTGNNIALVSGATFSSPSTGVTFKNLGTSDPEKSVYVGNLECGNGKIDAFEECDGSAFNYESCKSLGYETGKLSCTGDCKIDTGLCVVNICGEKGELLGGRVCSGSFRVVDDELKVIGPYKTIPENDTNINWDDLRKSTENINVLSTRSPGVRYATKQGLSSNSLDKLFSIYRLLVPFDTSKLPENTEILNASVRLDIEGYNTNTPDDPNTFMSIVPFSKDNNYNGLLRKEDFDNFGSIDNPTELGSRAYLKEQLGNRVGIEFFQSRPGHLLFNLNNAGFEEILAGGHSFFGFRTSPDLSNLPPNNGKEYYLYLTMYEKYLTSGDNLNHDLKVKYKVPEYTYIVNEENEAIVGDVTITLLKKVGENWVEERKIYENSINLEPFETISVEDLGIGNSLGVIQPGDYKILLEIENSGNVEFVEDEFNVKPTSCGNGVREGSEVCDGLDMGQYSGQVNSCKLFDGKYISGKLKCSESCMNFITDSCVENTGRACSEGDVRNSDGTCTAIFVADKKDSTLSFSNLDLFTLNYRGLDYNSFKYAGIADKSEDSGNYNTVSSDYRVSNDNDRSGYVKIIPNNLKRMALSFNTDKLPEDVKIIDASLKLKNRDLGAYTPSSFPHSSLSLVGVDLVDSPNVQVGDMGSFGDIELVEASSRIKFRDLSVGRDIMFKLNKNGKEYINPSGWTNLGITTLPDLSSEYLDNVINSDVSMIAKIYSADSSYKPKLEVIYVP